MNRPGVSRVLRSSAEASSFLNRTRNIPGRDATNIRADDARAFSSYRPLATPRMSGISGPAAS